MTAPVMPTWADISRAVSELYAERDGEWCGMPMPVEGLSLTIEDKNPWVETIRQLETLVQEPVSHVHTCAEADMEVRTINSWWSKSLQCDVAIVEYQGKRHAVRTHHYTGTRTTFVINTMMVTSIWNIHAERKALDMLAGLLKPHMFNAYLLTGMFLETSARSGLTYIFRRCRPTLVLNHRGPTNEVAIMCALCLHPIGYYQQSWAGSMVPTDEVVAHLLLMRGDEHLYWRRANQHEPDSPEAGL